MASPNRSSLLGMSTLLVVAAVSMVMAQAGAGAPPMYDVRTEATFRGTVESVDTVTGAGGRGRHALGGTHLTVKTGTEALAVHVGPTGYLAEKGITFAKGDALEVLGSRVTIGQESVVIARQIRKGENAWTLRDASGRPLWSGRGR